jgi:predicted MFS family arabinose efflux permease
MNQSISSQVDGRQAVPFNLSTLYGGYVLGVLLLVGLASWVDRQVFSIVLESMKHEMRFSDTQLGLLGGIAFGLFYAAVGLPIAAYADRLNRRNIISGAVLLWSVMTSFCGLASGFGSLFLTRMGVGIGEAGGSAPSQSLLSDYFPPEKRAFAMGVFFSHVPLGYVIAYALGAWSNVSLGWRGTFIAFGIPGLLLAMLVRLTVRELPRGYSERVRVPRAAPTLPEAIRYFLSRPSLRHLPMVGAAHGIGAFGAAVWMPAYFMRVHSMTVVEVGASLALIMGVVGLLGTLAGGYLSDLLVKKTGDARWYMWLPAIMLVTSIPFTILMYSSASPVVALAFYVVPALANHMLLGPVTASMQNLAGTRRRALVAAFYLFLVNLVAMGLGPFIVGALSDTFQAAWGNASLRYTLLVLVSTTCAWASIHLLLAARTINQDIAYARDQDALEDERRA